MLLYIHVLFSALWLGTAATLPFWGNRANRADHLHTVLGIIDTVFVLKCVFIMGGLITTLTTGLLLANQYQFYLLQPWLNPSWLFWAEVITLIIFINSWLIFYFLVVGRKGKRSLMRRVPAIGYSNIALIGLVYFLMVTKPEASQTLKLVGISCAIILLLNLVNLVVKLKKWHRIKQMSAAEFAEYYFSLLNAEKMTDLLKLFRDDAVFNDPFATSEIKGILNIEQFFQKLGDQFDEIKICPEQVDGDSDRVEILWCAIGKTQNGQIMPALRGSNIMQRSQGLICQVDIDFDLNDLPNVQRVSLS